MANHIIIFFLDREIESNHLIYAYECVWMTGEVQDEMEPRGAYLPLPLKSRSLVFSSFHFFFLSSSILIPIYTYWVDSPPM